MRRTLLAVSLLGLLLTAHCAVTARGMSQSAQDRERLDTIEPSIQITRVTVTPDEIHTMQEPNAATVTVQVGVFGRVPGASVATLGVLTASSEPPGNNVRYSDPQTLPLKTSPTVLKFKVYAGSQTLKDVAANALVRLDQK